MTEYEMVALYDKMVKEKDKENERLNDKLNDTERRIDKAIEYIKENQEEEYVTGNSMLSYWAIEDLLNILQGEDKQ